MPAQIDRDSLVARGEMRRLRVPVAVRTAEAVDQNDCRAAFACYDVMDGICALWELTMAMAYRRELPLSQFSGPPSSVIRCISRCSP